MEWRRRSTRKPVIGFGSGDGNVDGNEELINEYNKKGREIEKWRKEGTNLANVTVFTLLLGVFEGGQASSINSGHFEIGDEFEDPMRERIKTLKIGEEK